MNKQVLTNDQVKLLAYIEDQGGKVHSMLMYRSQVSVAAGMARRGLLIKGKGMGVTYSLAK